MTKIYIWRGALGDAAVLEAHREAMDALIHGTYARGNLETLKGHRDIFSYRLNRTERLLFTTMLVDGHRYLLLLEHLPTHDYQKSRFLRSGVLNRYLINHGEALAADAQTFEPVIDAPDVLQGLEDIDAPSITLDYYKNKFIQLSHVQEEVFMARLPVVISGVAGSGKSCVAMGLLSDDTQRYIRDKLDEPRKILYVTESFQLALSMERAWEDLPVAQHLPQHLTIEFKTYDQLLHSLDEINGKTVVDRADFEEWYALYFKKQQRMAKVTEAPIPPLDAEAMYQEFRICSAYSEKAYYALGERQSTLPKGDARHTLYDAYQKYMVALGQSNRLHPSFHVLTKMESYDLIVVDESQDLSHLQLKNLAYLAKKRYVAFCMDSHQSLHDTLSKRPFLLEMLKRHDRDVISHIELPVTYRCPVKIARVADVLIQAKYHLTGGTADKKEAPSVVPHVGEGAGFGNVLVINPKTLSSWAWLNHQAQGAHFAVVAMPEFIDSAKGLFPHDRVFTPFEIKGLEYDTVVVFHPFLNESMKKAARYMDDFDLTAHKLHRAKADAGNEQFVTPFNELLTSVTRARQTLVICEDECRETLPFLKPLRAIMADTTLLDAEHEKETTTADWQAEILRQADEGHLERATIIYCVHLKQAKETFPAFLEKNRKKEPASQPAPLVAIEAVMPVPKDKSEEVLGNPVAPKEASPPNTRRVSAPAAKEHAKTKISGLKTSLLSLLNEFSDMHLILFFREMPLNTDWFTPCVHYNGQSLPLLHHLFKDPHKLDLFIQCIINDPILFQKIHAKRFIDTVFAFEKKERGLAPKHKNFLLGIFLMNHLDLLKDQAVSEWLKTALKAKDVENIQDTLVYSLTESNAGTLFLSHLHEKYFKLFSKIPLDLWFMTSQETLNTSPFYWITSTSAGQSFVLKLLQTYHPFVDSITVNALTVTCPKSAGTRANLSPFYNLSMTEQGITVLQLLFEKKPELLKSIANSVSAVLHPQDVTQPGNNLPLYGLLRTNIKGQSLLREMIEINPEFLSSIPASALTLLQPSIINSAIYELCRSSEGLHILRLLLEKNPEIVTSLPVTTWIHRFNDPSGKSDLLTPLFALCYSQAGQAFLRLLLEKNPALITSIPATAWTLPLPSSTVRFENQSPLYKLCSSIHGLNLLRFLFEKNPGLFKIIPAKAWTLTHPFSKETSDYISPLYHLSTSVGGIDFLRLLFEMNPELLLSIPVDAWTLTRPGSHISPIYGLSNHKDGQYLLQLLLEKNPELIASIPASVWTRSINDPSGKLNRMSPLHGLCHWQMGQTFLRLLFEKNPTLITSIPEAAWTLPLPASVVGFENISPLSGLCTNSYGPSVLRLLLEKNPELFKVIPATAWTLAYPVSKETSDYISPLYNLSTTMEGVAFLRLLFEMNPDLLSSIPISAWTFTRPASKSYSPLYGLTSSIEGQRILQLLFKKNPELIMSIPATTWTIPLYNPSDKYNLISPLYHLCRWQEGQTFLRLLFEKNPTLMKSILTMAWTMPTSAVEFENCSPIYELCSNPHDLTMLHFLLEKNPELLKSIPATTWTQAHPVFEKSSDSISPLYHLSTTKEGVAFLRLLFETNPKLLSTIPASAWTLPRPKSAGSFENNSPLFELASKHEGLAILRLLFEKNPTLITSTPASVWTRARNARSGVYANTSVLFYLCFSEAGQDLLRLLFEKNPTLIMAIPASAWTLATQVTVNKLKNRCPLHGLCMTTFGQALIRELLEKKPDLQTTIPADILTMLTPPTHSNPHQFFSDKQPGLLEPLPFQKEGAKRESPSPQV